MIRTTILFLVLTLAGTPAATALCIGKCEADAPSTGTAAACHQRATREGMPGVLAGEHGCDTQLQAVPFVREDVQRIASGSASDHAVVVIPHFLPGSAPPETHGTVPHGVPVSRVSGSTVLRI